LILIWIGALLVLCGVLLLALQPLRRGRLSGGKLASADTLEPRRPASGFGLTSNWPGLLLFALGVVLLLAAAFI
jgi:drug/metabolite transporter (DMT)-like permease